MDIHGRRWQITRLAVLQRDAYRCRMLLGPDGLPLADQLDRTAGTEHGIQLTRWPVNAPTHATVDHIVARTSGGGGAEDNLQAACRRCNSQRSAVVVNATRTAPLNVSRAWW